MSPDLERLISLQQLDSTIRDARQQITAHPQRLADADARLDTAARAVDVEKLHLKESQDARREAEKNASVFQGRVTKFKDQLSAVKTNREFTAMQHEIETAERELGVAEEKVLERMVEGDAIAADVKAAESALAAKKKEIEAEKSALARELTEHEVTLTRALESRDAIVANIESRLMAIFDQVARVRKGVAICTATRDGLCSVCHVRLRPQVFQLVRQNDSVIQCDSCQRILYYIAPPAPVDPPAAHPA